MEIKGGMLRKLLKIQSFEITEYYILKNVALSVKKDSVKAILHKLADYSKKHYDCLKEHTGQDIGENNLLVLGFVLLARITGLTFCIKLIEKRESSAVAIYKELSKTHPEFGALVKDEEENEKDARDLIDEEILKYIGSVVLGLNDALVELTGALAGFTLAMQNNRLIGSAGLITGIAASLSMASSEFLSTKSEKKTEKNPVKASIYTGIAYILTVLFLIFPYFISHNYIVSLCITLFNAALVILVFSFYASVAQETSFRKRFLENIGISFGIATISFLIGYLVRTFLHIQI